MIPKCLGCHCAGTGTATFDSWLLFTPDGSSPCCPDPPPGLCCFVVLMAQPHGARLAPPPRSHYCISFDTPGQDPRGRTAKVSEHSVKLYISSS
jgi:hypothetical protein